MPTERQLANLRPPIRCGEVLNPQGRNQWTRKNETRAAFDAIVETLKEAPPEVTERLQQKLVELIVAGAIDGDRQLQLQLFRFMLIRGW